MEMNECGLEKEMNTWKSWEEIKATQILIKTKIAVWLSVIIKSQMLWFN